MKLPRLTGRVAVTDKPASITFARNWDQVCTAVENMTANSVTSSSDLATTGYIIITLSTGKQVKLAVVG